MTKEEIIEMIMQIGGCDRPEDDSPAVKMFEAFAKLVAEHEREAIAQMFEDAPALVEFAQNDKGGCLICGFTPEIAIKSIRARGNET